MSELRAAPAVLDLPGGPREVFAAVEPVLSRYFLPDGYRIGGGTALAGRWRHRHSTDVDLFAEPSLYLAVVTSRGPEMERALIEEVPDILPERSWVEPEHIHLSFPDSEATMLPVAHIHPESPDAPRIRGSAVKAEGVAEILSKKIRLRMLGEGAYLIRDLYDLAAAALRDPEALRAALAAESPRRLRRIVEELGTLDSLGGTLLRPAFPWTPGEICETVARVCGEAAGRTPR